MFALIISKLERTKLYKNHLKKAKTKIKSIVIKPIQSKSYPARGRVDLIDLSDMNLSEKMLPDRTVDSIFE